MMAAGRENKDSFVADRGQSRALETKGALFKLKQDLNEFGLPFGRGEATVKG